MSGARSIAAATRKAPDGFYRRYAEELIERLIAARTTAQATPSPAALGNLAAIQSDIIALLAIGCAHDPRPF